jgi:hypothetical protein
MPAYNPPEQVLFSPVTNYYQGKAIRAQQKAAEQDAEIKGLQIDALKRAASPEAMRAAAEQAERDIREQEADIRKTSMETDADLRAMRTEAYAPVFAGIAENVEAGKPVDLVKTTEALKQAARSINEDEYQNFIKVADKNADGILDEYELSVAAKVWSIQNGKSYQQADFISPDGRAVQGSFDPETGEYIESDMSPIAPQATQGDISDPRTPSQQGAAHDENLSQYNESSNVQEMIGAVLPRVSDLPGAVGFTGKAAIAGAGVLTTMGYDEAATAFSQWLASANPEEVAGVMAQLQAVRGQLIPIVTGQESRARLSDQEQQLGDKAVALINQIQGPSDLAKAYPQVVGALRQFYEESWAKQYRIAKQDEFIDWPYDLTDRDEMVDFVQEALNAGLDEDSIRRMVTRMKLIQGVGSE